MFPGPAASRTERQMNLSQLAEIAEVVAQQNDGAQHSLNQNLASINGRNKQPTTGSTLRGFGASGSKIACNPFAAVSASLRKRSHGHTTINTTTGSLGSMQSSNINSSGPPRKRRAFLSQPTTSTTEDVVVDEQTKVVTTQVLDTANASGKALALRRVSTLTTGSASGDNSTDGEEEEGQEETLPEESGGAAEGGSVDGEEGDPKGVRFREYQAEIWSEKFEDLCEFRKRFGHCHVPHTFEHNPALAQWVKRQRYQYKLKSEGKRSTLSEERIRLLNKIGFIWNSHDVVWEERWYELLAFKHIHGHCIVPSNYEKNPQLAVWVKRQRRQFKFYQDKKPTSMTPERIAKLDQLGFAWDCRKNLGNASAKINASKVGGRPASVSPPPPPLDSAHGSRVESVKRVAGIEHEQLLASSTQNATEQEMERQPIRKLDVSRLGGFPLPATRQAPPSVTNFPQPSSTTLLPREERVGLNANTKATPGSRSTDGLPCEFLSFSRKFTKFPRVPLPKYS